MNSINTRSLTAAEIHDRSIRDGNAIILKKYGSEAAKRYGIQSDKFVPSPAEKTYAAVKRGVAAAFRQFNARAKAAVR